MSGKFENVFANIICWFMPNKYLRHGIRRYFSGFTSQEHRMLAGAILDPNGFGMLEALMWEAKIPKRHKAAFYRIRQGHVCIDCGANIGLVSDIILRLGGICYAFEPEPDTANILKMKFTTNRNFKLLPCAVGNRAGKVRFRSNGSASLGAHVLNEVTENRLKHDYVNNLSPYEVDVLRLTDFIRELLVEHEKIFILKIDIEGLEYDVLEDIIETGLHEKIEHIFVEPHENALPGLQSKAAAVRRAVKERGIENIHFDWI